jgi:threonine/homoserine/homoserine lactone efflux protein
MGAVFAAAAAPSCLLWLAFGAALQRALTDARRARVFNTVMGALLAASVVFVVS